MMSSRPPERPFDPNSLFDRLAEHEVSYVLVGGVAARLLGSPMFTQDADLVPEPTPVNYERFAAALSGPRTYRIDPRFRKPTAHPVVDPSEFGDGITSYYTAFGRVDVLSTIPGSSGYEALVADAETLTLRNGLSLRVANLDALIRSKETLARPVDVAALPALYELRARRSGEVPPAT